MRFLALLIALCGTGFAQAPTLGALYQSGESALRQGDLEAAAKAFREILKSAPNSAGAHANLAVVFMRRKEWALALDELRKARDLAPSVAGIRLNIGIVEYRAGNFPAAVPAFESVLKDQPDSAQARYLLGICYFLTERYGDAFETLTPLQEQEQANLQFLYVMAIAAGKSGHGDVERIAMDRLQTVAGDSAEMHLLIGKAHLAREEPEPALNEFRKAAAMNPKLDFVHYYLGVLARQEQNLETARTEFLADLAIEPDNPFDFEQLGEVYVGLDRTAEAEQAFRKANQLQPGLIASHFNLAKLYRQRGRLQDALTEIGMVQKLEPETARTHYLRGQILLGLHRREEALAEMEKARAMSRTVLEDLERKISGPVPDPSMTKDLPQVK